MYNTKKHLKVSMDIGTSFTKYAVIKHLNGEETFIDAKIISSPTDFMNDDGVIVDPDKLTTFLDYILHNIKQLKKVKGFDLVVYLTLPYVENRTIHFPETYYENKDFDRELNKLIDSSDKYDTQNFVFNFDYSNNITTPLAVCDALIVGYDSKVINFYLKYFDSKNIFVKSITLSNFAIIETLDENNEEEIDQDFYGANHDLLINLGSESTEVVLLKNNFPINYFIVNMGANSLTKALQNNLGIDVQSAETLKIQTNEEYCIFQEDGEPLPDSPEARDVIEILDPVFREWINTLYSEVSGELTLRKIPFVNKVYTTGGGSYIKNFSEAIANYFSAEFCELNISNLYDLEKIKEQSEIIYYNLDLFLPVLTHVKGEPLNLVRKEYIKSKKTKIPNFKGGSIILSLGMALFISSNLFGYYQTSTNNSDITKINEDMEALMLTYNRAKNSTKEFKELESAVLAYEEKLINNIDWSDLMRRTYDATPSNVQILKVHKIGDNLIEIQGRALDYELIGIFGKQLEKHGALKDIQVSDVENEAVKNGSLNDEGDLVESEDTINLKKFIIRGQIPEGNSLGGSANE